MARDGMTALIQRLRNVADAGTAEYTSGTITYWADNDLQAILDRHVTQAIEAPGQWRLETQTDGSGSAVYKVLNLPLRDWETVDSGTARFYIVDGVGNVQSTAEYTADYERGVVTFSNNRDGTAYYVVGYSYDIYSAAVEIYEQRLAQFSQWYDFKADNQTFSRSQAFKQLRDMVSYFEGKAGANKTQGSLRISQFVRSDINHRHYL